METYGFTFQTPRHSLSWITDTRYFDNLPGYYTGELLIINREIIKEIRPRKVIITHFGMALWQSKPWELAQELSQETGISVTAAYDGMKFDLAKLGK